LLFPGRREPWCLTLWVPGDGFWDPLAYRWRMWIEEGFRDLKGGGLGLDRQRMRTGVSLGGWLWLAFMAMVVWVLLGAVLRGAGWWPQVVAYPERQSLFRLGWIALAQGPPRLGEVVARALEGLLQDLLQRRGK